jgi:predicted ATPase/class 3 adenylate cyclase
MRDGPAADAGTLPTRIRAPHPGPRLDPRLSAPHDEAVPQNLPIGTVTFLFTDIEGSTRLLQSVGADFRDMLERHAAIVRQALAEHGGIEVSTEGDAFFAVFRSATEAAAAAVAAQHGLAEHGWPPGQPVRVRMGLHSGEGRLGGENYVGLDVHRAARIAAAGHGGQVLLSAASRTLVEAALPEGVTLRDLGSHRLKDLDQPEHLTQLVIRGLQEDFPAVRSLETPSNLPSELTSFVGRVREVDVATELLATTRLLTLTGPGGTGKTRLAIRIADGLGSSFRDGVFFVELAPLSDPALVGPTVARRLGLSDQAERPIVDLLRTHLESREVLLVLDNFEHLLPAGEIVADLLASAPGLKALVTSRSSLNLYGEQEFAVPPLTLPDAGVPVDLDRLPTYEAVALFIERARAVKPAFAITEDSAPALIGICLRLDGLPLAIELAASRIRLLEPTEILSRLEQHLPVLTAGAGNLPARQRTLRGAIEWSYDLLQPAERKLFDRLAVFAGGCSLEAADAICNAGGELGLDTFDGMASLVGQSLVRQSAETGESRFGMLETIREFGRDRMEADGSLEQIGRRHVVYFRDLAELAEPQFVASDQAVWLDRFDREHENVRAALRRALDAGDTPDGLRLAAAMWRFWFQRGYLREGRRWLEDLLAVEPDDVSTIRAKAYGALGGLAYWLSDVEATEAAYASAVRLYDAVGDKSAEAEALYNLAFVPVLRQDNDESRRRFEASLALAREIERPDLVAKSQIGVGISGVERDPQAALALFEEALQYFREVGDRFQIGDTLTGVAQAHRVLGHHEAGRNAYLEALQLFTEARNLPGIGMALEELSALESSAARHAGAMRLMGAAAALRDTTGASAPITLMRLGNVESAARQAIGAEAVEQALAEGRRMTLEQAVEFAAGLAE